MRRIADFIRGVFALTFTLALLVGVPVGLAAIIGWPLPTELPSVDLIRQHIIDADIPDVFVIKVLATIVWLTWAQLTVAILVEFAAVVRGRVAGRAPVMPGIQMFAARLATWVTLIVTSLGPARPAMAAPLQGLIAPPTATQMVDLDEDLTIITPADLSYLVADGNGNVDVATSAEGRYQTTAGDSWWEISRRLLGDGLRWNEIRSLNIGTTMGDGSVISPTTETVHPNWLLQVPPDAASDYLVIGAQTGDPGDEDSSNETDQPSEGVADGSMVTVQPGDHFWKLSKEALTDAWGRPPTNAELTPYWAEMVEANRNRLLPPEDADLIYPTQQFLVPPTPANPDVAHDVSGTDVDGEQPIPDTTERPETTLTPPPVPTPDPAPAVEEPSEISPPVAPTRPPATLPAPPVEADLSESPSVASRVLDVAKPAAIIATGLGLLGGLLMFTVRRLRYIQAARRRPGTVLNPPDEDVNAFEERIRAIATDGEDVRYIAATNQYLAHQLEGQPAASIPSVVAMRAGQFGLEVLLDEPCTPVNGFIAAAADNTAWRLHPDTTARMMEADAAGDAHPFSPGLLVVGGTDAGDLLVDFEQLGTVSIEGADHEVAAFQRGLIASAITAPWAQECRIITVGIDGLSGEALSRVETPQEPKIWVDAIATEHSAIARSLHRSPYEERVSHGEVHHPTLIFIGPGDDHAGIAQHLGPISSLAYAPLVVIAGAPILTEYRIAVETGAATLEPLGATFNPVQLDAADLNAADRLVATARDTATSPPTDLWAQDVDNAESTMTDTTGALTAATNEPDDAEVNGPADSVNLDLTRPDDRDQTDSVPCEEPSQSVLEKIEQIMMPKPVEVLLLGRAPKVTGCKNNPSPKLEAIISYMAFHREAASQRLREEFWPASTRRQAADNAIGKVRALLGQTDEGTPRLESAINSGKYTLSDDVGCDWDRVERLVKLAADAPTTADEAAALDAACELIQGRVGVDAPPANYGWLLNDSGTYTRIETILVDASHRRGELALAEGNVERANWAARKGLQVVEGQEALYRIQMRAAAENGDTEGVKAAYREAQRAAESYGFEEEVQPETQALFASLTSGAQLPIADTTDRT